MTCGSKVTKILYGGDYNPEQWPRQMWEEDMRLLKDAHIDIVTLNVFSWAALQPSEEEYQFGQLDEIMDLVEKYGMKVCLATSTGAHPAWMARRHPDILRTEFDGRKRRFGGRHNSCPSSPSYRKYAVRLAEKLAERYGKYDNLAAWHVSNEFGGSCYCENCERAFRSWLKLRYQNMEELNRAWNTAFWGHTFYDWDEIVLPNLLSEHFDIDKTQFQGISLDYRRFNSEQLLECFRMEYDAIKKFTPHIPVTTNLMGFYKDLDYGLWADQMDFVSWDSYPAWDDSPAMAAMSHDLMRGIGHGTPFVLMEQTPSVTNWQPYNALKRPGQMRLLSYQAVAHGADAVMFFQMRRSIGACEKFHGAVIDHVGTGETRVYREAAALGEELKNLGDRTLGAVSKARVGLYFDWENWWAIEYSAGPSVDLKYKNEIYRFYSALFELGIPMDFIGPRDELSSYKAVLAPVLYMVKSGMDEKIRSFVKEGGIFVTTFFSGIVEEHDLVVTGGYPGRLRDILGIWVEETDALPPGKENTFFYEGKEYPARLLCDLSHPEGARVLASYEQDFYAGMPVLTENPFGQGKAYYVATASSPEFYNAFLKEICGAANILPTVEWEKTAAGTGSMEAEKQDKESFKEGWLEVTVRENENGRFLFLLNHGEAQASARMFEAGRELLTGRFYEAGEAVILEPRGVKIIMLQAESGKERNP